MTPEQRANHDNMVQFLQEQDALYESAADAGGSGWRHTSVEWYEPIIMTRADYIDIDTGSRIDSFVKLEGGKGLRIGKRVHIASFVHLNIGGGSLTIGDGAAFASGAKVITGGNVDAGHSMSASAESKDQQLYARDVVIGVNAAMLTNSVLIGASMGDGAVLAAGGVATKDIPAYEVWGGVPAKFMRRRKGR